MELGINDISSIENRHRKEKKELQALIQSLKKIAKNDKTKKKELASEISRLELELDNRHKQELESTIKDEDVDDLPIAQNAANEDTKAKVSKAQKRRDKKSEQEKKRAEEIKLQEKENLNGPRNIENKAIIAKLKEKRSKLFQIPSDGDCLYKAIAHQMETMRQKSLSVVELRQMVSDYIKQNKDDFLPFMSNPVTCEMLNDAEFEEYCNKITNSKVWGGQLEIRALSKSLKCPINVIQATGPDSIEQGMEFEGPPLVVTYHRHMYSLGEHYNSTQSFNEDSEEND